MTSRRSWWGWGYERAAYDGEALAGIGGMLADRFEVDPPAPSDPMDPEAIALATPRVAAPEGLAALASRDPVDRLRHGHGASFREIVRALHGDVPHPPDLVVRPRHRDDVARVLDWCSDAGVICVPWGGGTSVVGGVTPPPEPSISLDLEHLDRVLQVDDVSGHAHIEGGAMGPAIEARLAEHGLTFRHFPQSWEFSTLGGWIATRAGGHFATGPTHIDDLVAAIGAETPTGRWASRRLPGSGAGPSPGRWLLGSEGTLGVVTDAWVRVQARPSSRVQATARFASFGAGLDAVRAVARDGLTPANCRLLDPMEAGLAGAAPPDGSQTVLVLGFEAAERELTAEADRALELVRDHGGEVVEGPIVRRGEATGAATGGAGAWREAFLRGPYLRDAVARLGGIAETFETACPWDRAHELVATLRETAQQAATEVCGAALVAVRTTHAYPDGVAPYLTVIAPGPGPADRSGPARGRAQAAAWDEVKAAVSEVVDAASATITHHHAIGRDHRPWYDRQRPDPFARALRVARSELDPAGILNPGVLTDAGTRAESDAWSPHRPDAST